MRWNILGRVLGAVLGTEGPRTTAGPEAGMSRRRMLAGVGFAGAAVAAAPFMLAAGNARAALRPEGTADEADTARGIVEGDEPELAQAPRDYRGAPRRREPPPRRAPPRRAPPRRAPPPRRGPPPRAQRYSRRDIRRRCSRDHSFRRRNPTICYRARSAPGRRGSCIRVGPVEICD